MCAGECKKTLSSTSYNEFHGDIMCTTCHRRRSCSATVTATVTVTQTANSTATASSAAAAAADDDDDDNDDDHDHDDDDEDGDNGATSQSHSHTVKQHYTYFTPSALSVINFSRKLKTHYLSVAFNV